jgi:hypothetical protein
VLGLESQIPYYTVTLSNVQVMRCPIVLVFCLFSDARSSGTLTSTESEQKHFNASARLARAAWAHVPLLWSHSEDPFDALL